MNETNYNFELALNTSVSRQFKAFVKDLGEPVKHNCMLKFFRGVLEISSSTMLNANGTLGRTASVTPQNFNMIEISKFASKFNASMSIAQDSRHIFIDIIDEIPGQAVLKVKIVPRNLAAKMALSNFFSIIEF